MCPSPMVTHESHPSAPPIIGGASPPAGSCGCSPGLHDRHATPSDEYRPYAHRVQLECSASTAEPAPHGRQVDPSVLKRFAPPVRVAHSRHAVASKAAFGCDPAAHVSQDSPWALYVPTQLSQSVFSTFGADPALHRMHMPPSVLNRPAGHSSQACCSELGCCPGWHVSQLCITPLPSSSVL